MKKIKFSNTDDYIASFPENIQNRLEEMRSILKRLVPGAKEAIKYGMPTLILNKNLVYYGGFKNHIGFYPVPTDNKEFREAFSQYKTGKGSIQFPLDKELPEALIKKIISVLI